MRARELGLTPGRLSPGPLNAITDVAGVRVGHCTLSHDDGRRPVRTGVTAIVPSVEASPGARERSSELYDERLLAGSFVLNGAGELSGLAQLREWGLIETPILLTNTLGVPAAYDALLSYTIERAPGLGSSTDLVIPLVGECDDSWLHDARGRHVQAEHGLRALSAASSGGVAEGNVGAGTGMITCDFAGGIGTASRLVNYAHATYTLGVLVLSNFGKQADLLMDGLRIGELLSDSPDAGVRVRRQAYGSIVAVLATDAPLLPMQLNRICKRMALGMGRAGSSAGHGSGEIALAFSTAQSVPRERKSALWQPLCLHDAELNPLFQAAIEATEEAILNALCAGKDAYGVDGHFCPALPLAAVRELVSTRRPG